MKLTNLEKESPFTWDGLVIFFYLVSAVLAYLAVCSGVLGPLFLSKDGSVLIHSHLVTAFCTTLSQAGWNVDGFCSHCFRIGAASVAAQASLPDSLIQTLSCWKSSTFLAEIYTPSCQLLSVLHIMAVRAGQELNY